MMEPEPNTDTSNRPPLEEVPDMDGNDDGEKHWWKERTLWTRIWQGGAIASFVINLVAMAIEGSTMVIIAGIIALGIAPAVFYFQLQLQEEGTLRMVQNELRKEVNKLQIENNELAANSTRLEKQVDSLKEKETKLQEITQEQGTNVESFVGLVKENQTTLDGLKRCVKADTEQVYISAVLESDWDESNTFSDREVKMLEIRLKNIPGVTVDTEKLSSHVNATDRSLTSLLNILSELNDDDMPEEERIFHVHEKDLIGQK